MKNEIKTGGNNRLGKKKLYTRYRQATTCSQTNYHFHYNVYKILWKVHNNTNLHSKYQADDQGEEARKYKKMFNLNFYIKMIDGHYINPNFIQLYD